MQRLRRHLAFAVVLIGSAPAFAAGHLAELSAEETVVVERAPAWIEEGWSPLEDTEGFGFDRVAGFYDGGEGTLSLHDANDPAMRLRRTAREHVEAFVPLVRGASFLDNEWIALENVAVSGDLAFTAFTADAIFRDPEGAETRDAFLYSLAWRRWRVAHRPRARHADRDRVNAAIAARCAYGCGGHEHDLRRDPPHLRLRGRARGRPYRLRRDAGRRRSRATSDPTTTGRGASRFCAARPAGREPVEAASPMKHGAATDPGEALRTLLARAPNILVIPGTTTIAHLEENARAHVGLPLKPGD